MQQPLVSCIMPTANRQQYVPLAVDYFLNQDFRDAELVIIDDGRESVAPLLPVHRRLKYVYTSPLGSIGSKRNIACEKAAGKIIMHWDDDDWYAQDWISKQLHAIEKSPWADICGLNEVLFFSPMVNRYWKYSDKSIDRPWICGATMTYRKTFWKKHPFKDIQVGEDYDYIWNKGAKLCAHDYTEGFYAILHARNTTIKPFEESRHKKNGVQWMEVQYEGKTIH
ncbi:glycosyltransferase family 2 protein [Pedobacter sp. AW31-3R]|uniref:glycosyltransferase family 2 protein n=1 Tax=Pedobacter sp. AW31-3R TaxID=3445781 RepID=UPI003FA04B2D